MKKNFIILFAVLSTLMSFAQIKTMSSAEIKTEKVTYDVTKNFLGSNNVETYVGQILYVKGMPQEWRKSGYENFYASNNCDILKGERYGEPAPENKYKTQYEDLFGKYFMVISVIPQKESWGGYSDKYIFKLQNRDNENDICYYCYDGRDISLFFPFITLSHFEWHKKKIGKKYFLTFFQKEGKICANRVGRNDFITGEPIIYNESDIWECVDVIVESNDYQLKWLLKNKNGNIIAYDLDPIFETKGQIDIIEEYQYNNLVNKYGKIMVDAMRKRCIRIGMSKELLIMSWGSPEKINSNSYGADQWVYGETCVYVSNGKVEGWN